MFGFDSAKVGRRSRRRSAPAAVEQFHSISLIANCHGDKGWFIIINDILYE